MEENPVMMTTNKRLSTSQVKNKVSEIFQDWLIRKDTDLATKLVRSRKLEAMASKIFDRLVPSWIGWYMDAPSLEDGCYYAWVHLPESGTLMVSIKASQVETVLDKLGSDPDLVWHYFDGERFEPAEDLTGAVGRLIFFDCPSITNEQAKLYKYGPF